MKIRSNLLILSLAFAAVLSGCGEVEDEARAAGAGKAPAAVSVSGSGDENGAQQSGEAAQKSEANEDGGTQTSADPRQVPKTQEPAEPIEPTEPTEPAETSAQTTETPVMTPVEPVTSAAQGGEVLTPENISSYQFGFELYSDGHKDCWEQRYECAKVMLEAVSQTNAAENTVDLIVSAEQLNEKESSGFMTWLKFEDPMSFQVGDTVMSGSSLNMIDYDGSYYFFIGEIEEMTGMISLDSSYISKILEAAGC